MLGKVLIIAGDGTASDHLDYAYFRMLEEGHEVVIAGPVKRPLLTAIHQASMGDHIYTFERQGYPTPVQAQFDEVDPAQFDGLLLPGGRAPEYLRTMPAALALVRHFIDANKVIGAMCHGPVLLIAAGLTGRTLTCTDDTRCELTDAGNVFVEAHGPAEGQPDHVIDGNLLTVRRRPFHYVWVREFLKLLEKNGAGAPATRHLTLPQGARILIIAGDFTSGGQILYAYDRMLEADYQVVVAAPEQKRLDTIVDPREEGWNGIADRPAYDYERLGFWMPAQMALQDVDPNDFDGLLLPGWRATEYLRNMPHCIRLIRHFMDEAKPIGAICQAARLLIAAGVRGRRMTGTPFIEIEIDRLNDYVDAQGEPVIDGNIATVSGRPHYHVWTRAFMTLLAGKNSAERPEMLGAA